MRVPQTCKNNKRGLNPKPSTQNMQIIIKTLAIREKKKKKKKKNIKCPLYVKVRCIELNVTQLMRPAIETHKE